MGTNMRYFLIFLAVGAVTGGYFYFTDSEIKVGQGGYYTGKAEKILQEAPRTGKMWQAKKVEFINWGVPNDLPGKTKPMMVVFREGDRLTFDARLFFEETTQICRYRVRVKEVSINKDRKAVQFLPEAETCDEPQSFQTNAEYMK